MRIEDFKELKALVEYLKGQNIKEFVLDDLKIVFKDFEEPAELTEEQKEMLDKVESASDEDILMNPYAGME